MSPEFYTPELANRSLPLVRAIVSDVVALTGRVTEAHDAYAALREQPDRPQIALNEARARIAEMTASRDACLAELEGLGVLLGDATRGICDFPAEVDGAPVVLCWELGEARVEWYHGRDERHDTTSTRADGVRRRPLELAVTAS